MQSCNPVKPGSVIKLIAAFLVAVSCLTPGTSAKADGPEKDVQPLPVTAAGPAIRAAADEIHNIIFIFDSSGSMKAVAGGKTRIDAAKEVMSRIVGTLPGDVRAGLVAYGHRMGNDCNDIELLIPVGAIDVQSFTRKVQSMRPLGLTPITGAIRQAAEVLKSVQGRKTLILISDGQETCKGDPCGTAAELKAANIDLQFHVVGFGVEHPTVKNQLNCIAKVAGGMYKDAANAIELEKALIAFAKANAAPVGKGRLLTIGQDSNGEPLDLGLTLYRPGLTDKPLNTGKEGWTTAKLNELPAGTYDILFGAPYQAAVWKQKVVIKAGQETKVEIEQLGRVRLSIKDEQGNAVPMYGEVYLSLEPDRPIVTINHSTGTMDLPAGTYDIKFWSLDKPVVWRRGIEIRSGQETLTEAIVPKSDR